MLRFMKLGLTISAVACVTVFSASSLLIRDLPVEPISDPFKERRAHSQISPAGSLPDEVGAEGRYWNLSVSGLDADCLLTSEEAKVHDLARIVGVEVNGESRAYLLDAFEIVGVSPNPDDLANHIVNDEIAGTPICVTHCGLKDDTRVFQRGDGGPGKSGLADVRVGGWNDGMWLNIDGKLIPQTSASVPLEVVKSHVMAWGQWLKLHPKSLIYIGSRTRSNFVGF